MQCAQIRPLIFHELESRSCRGHKVMILATSTTVKELPIISSTGSCQVRCVSLDVAMILCIVTPHDREGPEAWPYARHERDILAREDKKDQNGFVLAHGGDTLSDPGAYFFL